MTVQTLDDLTNLEFVNTRVVSMIEHALEALGENDTIYNVRAWRTYELQSRQQQETTTDLFRTELRSAGVHRAITGIEEVPENDEDNQLWLFVAYTVLTYPDDEQEDRVKRFPARYLFMTEEEIKTAWQRHLNSVMQRGKTNV